MSEAPEFFEAGVFYYRNRFPTLEPIPATFTAVEYKWNHVPTGATGISKVWLDSKRKQQEDIKRLTDHWSNGTWVYEPVEKCQNEQRMNVMWDKEKEAFDEGKIVQSRQKTSCGLWGAWYKATHPQWHENGDTEYRVMPVSKQNDMAETVNIANEIEAMIEELKFITGSNGIGARKIHGKKENSVSEELHSMLCSISRIKMSAKEHAAE